MAKRFSNLNYNLSSKMQTLGVGRTSVKVTRFYKYEPTEGYGDFVSNIITDSVSSPEYSRLAQDYSYSKLKMIIITIAPRTIQTSTMNFFKIDWANSTATDVRYDDNSKLIYMNVTYPKIYKFKPPNTLLQLSIAYLNYSEWQQASKLISATLPGYLKVTSAVEFTFQVDTKWVFRGLNSISPSTRVLKVKPENIHNDIVDETIFELKKLAHKIDKVEEEIEEEEEEVKEEKRNKEQGEGKEIEEVSLSVNSININKENEDKIVGKVKMKEEEKNRGFLKKNKNRK